MKAVLFLLVSFIVSASSANDLVKALGAALKEAEKNHSATQVALEVDSEKIEKAKFHRSKDPSVIHLKSMLDVDRSPYATIDMADEVVVEDVEDRSIAKEVNDK